MLNVIAFLVYRLQSLLLKIHSSSACAFTLVSQVQLLRALFAIAFTRLVVLQADQPRI